MARGQAQNNHVPLEQDNFRGLFSRGITDTVPDSYFIDCLNNKFNESEVSTRDGSVLKTTKSNIVRFFAYKRLNETPRLIILDTAGNLVDSLAPGSPIYTDVTIVDFSMVNYNNRAYITVHNRIKGISSKSMLVYDGTTCRLAAGTAPTGFTLGAAVSATVGSVEEGYHLFAVAFITSTGFITAPGPATYKLLSCPGGFKVDISAIPTGGASIAGRVLLATKAIPVSLYNGNQNAYELFFVPGGTILNNTSTTLTINFFDADLLDSADYLVDNLATIPAGLGVMIYAGRLVTWCESGNEFTVRVSGLGTPEAFSSVTGFITLDPSDAISGVTNCFEFRKNLVISTRNRLYVTADNGSDPSTWSVDSVDKSTGLECFGVSNILDARGTNTDRAFLATRSGFISFEGYVKRPELSWNIEGVWNRINKAYFNLIQIVDDPNNHRVLISVPLDSATAISHILYADYSKAFTVYGTLDEKMVKWSIWTFPTVPVSIAADYDSVTFKPVIYVALAGGNVYSVKDGLTDDFSNAINSYITTSLKSALSNWINHFSMLKLRVLGSGTLNLTLYGEDAQGSTSAGTLTLTATPGLELDKLINFTNEKMSIKCAVNSLGDWFTISKITAWGKAEWLRRVS